MEKSKKILAAFMYGVAWPTIITLIGPFDLVKGMVVGAADVVKVYGKSLKNTTKAIDYVFKEDEPDFWDGYRILTEEEL